MFGRSARRAIHISISARVVFGRRDLCGRRVLPRGPLYKNKCRVGNTDLNLWVCRSIHKFREGMSEKAEERERVTRSIPKCCEERTKRRACSGHASLAKYMFFSTMCDSGSLHYFRRYSPHQALTPLLTFTNQPHVPHIRTRELLTHHKQRLASQST